MTDSAPDLNETSAPEDYSRETLHAMAWRLEQSASWEHFVYREAELDELWRLIEMDIEVLGDSASACAETVRLSRLAEFVIHAHDLIAEGSSAAAARCIDDAFALLAAHPPESYHGGNP